MTKSSAGDLTGRARIRNAALELWAERGVPGASMRQIADHAGVTVGLVTHHFGTKESLRRAVDDYVVERYREVLTAVPGTSDAHELFAARDRAVTQMLRGDQPLRDYMRQSFLSPADDDGLVERLVDFSLEELRRLRALGVVWSGRAEEDQVVLAVVRQMGALLLEPLIQRSWKHLGGRLGYEPKIEISAVHRDPPGES